MVNFMPVPVQPTLKHNKLAIVFHVITIGNVYTDVTLYA